ncbi:cupin domain-containing protein [Streptomyces scopuliridis]|nr:cupin domain-containing protein [Streptomyces scopuliridis]WSC07830.1 cupin domain-containing protein [Streptomyces scopuliridis]
MELEHWLRTGVQTNLYASLTAREGFGVHWDDHDVIVIQIDGAKRWKLYGPTRTAPQVQGHRRARAAAGTADHGAGPAPR